jgi:hypothetical protein
MILLKNARMVDLAIATSSVYDKLHRHFQNIFLYGLVESVLYRYNRVSIICIF